MRLLHAKELRFEEFFDSNVPPYAILSHRWGTEEISYQDVLAGRFKNSAGYKKVLRFCQTVTSSSDSWWVNWVWVDTCCIDKSSSAELSEAINSMYRWYTDALTCYVYMPDVAAHEDWSETMTKFRESVWFTRGWTLQELIAPYFSIFLDQDWKPLGDKQGLIQEISAATRIQSIHLQRMFFPDSVSIAEKMSWAAGRTTSREEDRSYCLMGLFGVNMPLLYGEGGKAFHRLQVEIIKTSNDESLFAWQDHDDTGSRDLHHYGMLAEGPERFAYQQVSHEKQFKMISNLPRPPYSITNQGLEIHVPRRVTFQQSFVLALNCRRFEDGILTGVYAIMLERDRPTGRWCRKSITSRGKHRVECCFGTWSSLCVVPMGNVWDRQALIDEHSEVIYLEI